MSSPEFVLPYKLRLKQTPLYSLLKPLVRLRWRLAGRPIPPPYTVKEDILTEYARVYGPRVLVETGTFLGDMVAQTRKLFDEVYTVELSDTLWRRAAKRFQDDPRVHVLHGDSAVVLPEVLGRITQPAIFWFDGHFSGGMTAQGKLDTPIMREMELVLAHPTPGHVILIDDARCFNGTEDYPILDEFVEWVGMRVPYHKVVVQDDIIRVTPSVA